MQGAKMNIKKLNKSAIINAYHNEDWGSLPNFAGNFINFGYWKDILSENENRELALSERIQSSCDMYKKIADSLNISPHDTVLEIGCGRGIGTVYVAKRYKPQKSVGIDMNPNQIKTAEKITSATLLNALNVEFRCLDIEIEDIGSNLFDKIYSIEIFQHILSIDNALQNTFNALKKNGAVVITTFFLTKSLDHEQIRQLFPLTQTEQEYPVPIQEVEALFKKNGFKNIEITAIGDAVFHGYEKWITQERVDTSISHAYYANYRAGYLDYYEIKATK